MISYRPVAALCDSERGPPLGAVRVCAFFRPRLQGRTTAINTIAA